MIKEKVKMVGIMGIIGIIVGGRYVYGYSYSGHKWSSNPTYYIYESFDWWIGRGVGKELKGAWEHAKKGADTWNNVTNCDFELKYGGKKWNIGGRKDGVNMVDAGMVPDNSALAVTFYWLNNKGEIEEVDTNFYYREKWSIPPWYAPWHCDPDKYDVQNAATHEFGHWLILNDLYNHSDSEKTMYGFATRGETKKRSLHQDDIDGIRHIYPQAAPPPPPSNGGCMNPEIGLDLSEKEIILLEKLREKLISNPSDISTLYFQFETEIMSLFRMNPRLRKQTKGLIQHFADDLNSLMNGKNRRILEKNEIELFDAWLLELGKYASPPFKNKILHFKEMIRNTKTIDEVFNLNSSESEDENIEFPKEPEFEKPETSPIFQTRFLSISPHSNGYTFSFELAENLDVSIRIYNIIGQKVNSINHGFLRPGRYSIYWNKTNASSEKVSKGLYFVHFTAGKITNTQKLLVR